MHPETPNSFSATRTAPSLCGRALAASRIKRLIHYCLPLSLGLLSAAAPGAESITLRAAAQARGKLIGYAINGAPGRDAEYDRVAAREFNVLVCENAMKFGNICPKARGEYDFSVADAIVAFAQTNHMKVRGHTLLWHMQQPQWLAQGYWSRQELADILHEHIGTLVRRYKGQVYAWDVINEAIADSRHTNEVYRRCNYYDVLGAEYLDTAFRWAREADPKARLFYNDYSTEFGGPKFEKMFTVLKGMKARGVPVDGVGLQMHIDLGAAGKSQALAGTIRRLSALGLEVQITELDVAMDLPADAAKLQRQAQIYGEVTSVAMREEACTALLMWGFTDKSSWLPWFSKGKRGCGLIYDERFQPKPAYAAMLQAMTARGGD